MVAATDHGGKESLPLFNLDAYDPKDERDVKAVVARIQLISTHSGATAAHIREKQTLQAWLRGSCLAAQILAVTSKEDKEK
jgi:hypothetical protein